MQLFAREDGLKKFRTLFGQPKNLTLTAFRTGTNIGQPKEDWVQWLKKLPPLSDFRVVVSDNLPEILELRQDAVLSGSFLWHIDIPAIDPSYKSYCEKLLIDHAPLHIAADFFVSDELRQKTRIIPVGLIGTPQNEDPEWSVKKQSLLISGGRNKILANELTNLVKELIQLDDRMGFREVWVDDELLPGEHPVWMKRADFDETMFKSLSVAVIRPGVGTVTDCLRHRVFMLAAAEEGNKEMQTNIQAITSSGNGREIKIEDLSFRSICALLEKEKRNPENPPGIPVKFNGEKDFADFIETQFGR